MPAAKSDEPNLYWGYNVYWLMETTVVLTDLATECCKRAARQGVYIYIRCMDSGLIEGEDPGNLYWKVSAELPARQGEESRSWRAEGYSLDHAVREAVGKVPVSAGTGQPPAKRRVIRRRKV
jgi:hypothetical protein